MPPEPLPWDRKELFRDRKHNHDFGASSRWRDSSSSSSYGGSRNNNNSDFSPRWGFPSSDFRRPPGHGKQGGWHMYPEDHGYSTPRSADRFMDDNNMFRPSGMRGDGRYGRFYRENRPSFGQRDWRGQSWEGNHHHGGPANGVGRPHTVNDQRAVGDSPVRASHPHSDPRDQIHAKEQVDKTGDANGSSSGQKVDKENLLGSLDWKPLKWSRSGSLTSRGSGFSHSSSSKSIGGESSDVKCDLPPKKVTPVQSPSGDAVACAPSVTPSEETSSRKKPRLGWGEGLAKYEKKKVDGPEDNVKSNAISASNVEPSHSLPSSLVVKSPKMSGFSDCSSPATPSSFACSSSPGLEDRTYGKAVDAGGDASNFSVSSMPVHESQLEGSHFRLEKLELKSVANLGSLLNELLQADDQCSMDSGFMRSSAFNKLLLWKGDISRTLELTETEIDSLENELTSLKAETDRSFHRPASSNSGPADYKDGPSDCQTVFPRPHPLEVVSNGEMISEDRLPCDDAGEVQAESKDEDIDSPGTATSKFVEPLVQKSISYDVCKNSSGESGFVESTKSAMDLGTSCQGHDRSVVQVNNIIAIDIENPGVCDKKVDSICDTVIASNKELANRASEGLLKLLPCSDSMVANRASCIPADSTMKEKFLRKKRSLRFKERVISLKYRAFHHLWKEDLRLLSLRSHRAKPQKKPDPSSRILQVGNQKNRSSIRSRFTSPAGSLSLVPTTEIINFTGKLLSDSQAKVYRNGLKMPAMILDEKEKMSRFLSNNGLVEDPCAVEKERSLINPWTFEEKELFMDKLATHGKDFRKISSFLDHKTTADCIEFYYKNHKSECFEKIKKLEVKKIGKPISANTYLVTSGKKWSREMNAASLDILGAASVIAAQADQALETSKLLLGKSSNKRSRGSDGIIEESSSLFGAEDERETAAADVLAGICGSLSSEAMSSCITSSVDPGEGNPERKHQKVGSSIRRPLTPEVTQNVDDDDTCSDESCGEMDPVDWTDDEKILFVQAFLSHGKDFLMISRRVRTKSSDQCKVFFSKARKCLGLDILPSGSGGNHASDDTNGGGSDTEDAGIVETGSIVCSDKSGSRIDEDLLQVNQDVSKPDVTIELNALEENCGPGQLDHKDSDLVLKDLVPQGHLADVSDPLACCGMVDVMVKDSATAVDTKRPEFHLMIQDDKTKVNTLLCRSATDVACHDSGVAVDMEAASGISDSISEVHVSSAPVKFVNPRDGLFKSSSVGNVHHLLSGSSMMNQSELCRDLKGFPLDLSVKSELHDVCTVGDESIDQSYQRSFLRKCSRAVSHNSVAELPLLQQSEDELGSSCSSKTEKSCRNGNVKLFGKILSKTSSVDKPTSNAVLHDEKAKHHSNQDVNGNSMSFADDHNSFLGLENVPIRSYGFWDGTKIQTGFPTLPDSALLLAKYPGAFSNYSISSPKSEQQPLPAAVNGNECNMNGACVFSPREFSSSNGGNVIDYTILRNQDGLQPFRLDMKKRPEDVVFPEVQRNGFESLKQQGKGVVKLNVVQGGDILGGSCSGISDPVAALKLHYASQQYGGVGGHSVNGIVREEPWRSQGGDVGR
ncbi:uncharacterized protein LOC110683740 isoform X1 [Chenopodium quinoa]|uniref:uncharacterized protein LOC110683740 isoform X1 n=1 Tax=Chenopodium quinoa TaxID=63459 RepID=UPI000B780CF1|nr:uncharacterized protein LOC110683740 isoform X1 [Chenopodium quinoa]